MLANVEDRMYIDPYGSMESMSLEEHKKKLRAKLERKALEKPKNIPEVVISSPQDVQSEDDFDEIDDDGIEEQESKIILNVDSLVSA